MEMTITGNCTTTSAVPHKCCICGAEWGTLLTPMPYAREAMYCHQCWKKTKPTPEFYVPYPEVN